MPVRTTIVISEEAYKKLVELAIKKYKHAKAISKVIEDLVMEKEKENSNKILRKVEELRNKGFKIDIKDVIKLIKESREEIAMKRLKIE